MHIIAFSRKTMKIGKYRNENVTDRKRSSKNKIWLGKKKKWVYICGVIKSKDSRQVEMQITINQLK